MSKLLCNVLKIPVGANAPNTTPWLRAWFEVKFISKNEIKK